MDDVLVEGFIEDGSVKIEDGLVKIEGAFPPRVAEDCARLLWQETGDDPDDPRTWKDPVYWVSGMTQDPFAAAANSPALYVAFEKVTQRWNADFTQSGGAVTAKNLG